MRRLSAVVRIHQLTTRLGGIARRFDLRRRWRRALARALSELDPLISGMADVDRLCERLCEMASELDKRPLEPYWDLDSGCVLVCDNGRITDRQLRVCVRRAMQSLSPCHPLFDLRINPGGLTYQHCRRYVVPVCGRKYCVNPRHLVPVGQRANQLAKGYMRKYRHEALGYVKSMDTLVADAKQALLQLAYQRKPK